MEWRRHPRYDAEVSDDGRIRFRDEQGNQSTTVGKPRNGLRMVKVNDPSYECDCFEWECVGKLVLETFRPELPGNFERRGQVRYLDDDTDNNRLTNLRWFRGGSRRGWTAQEDVEMNCAIEREPEPIEEYRLHPLGAWISNRGRVLRTNPGNPVEPGFICPDNMHYGVYPVSGDCRGKFRMHQVDGTYYNLGKLALEAWFPDRAGNHNGKGTVRYNNDMTRDNRLSNIRWALQGPGWTKQQLASRQLGT